MSFFHSLLYSAGEALPDVPASAPDYASLSNIAGIWDSTGLVIGTENSYGSVNSSGNVVTTIGVKSIAPGPTGRDMLAVDSTSGTGGISVQTIGEVNVIHCNGFGRLRNTSGSANWNFLHYNATFANLKWTVHMLVRPGFGADPGEVYGLLGNNGRTATGKGFTTSYDDREGASLSNNWASHISKGSTGFISTSSDNSKITPNTWQILTLTFDGSLTAANRMKAWIDDVSVAITVTSASTAVVTTPSYDLEIFANGNGVGIASGQWSHYVIQSGLETSEVQSAFVQTLIPWKEYLNAHMDSSACDRLRIYNTTQGDLTKYYLSASLCQNPTNLNTVVKIYTIGTDHVVEATKKLVLQKSTDRGVTFAASTDVSDPTGNLEIQDQAAGYDSTGRLYVLFDEHTAGGVNFEPNALKLRYSDSDGDSWTEVDVTSLVPADGSSTFRAYGNVISNGGDVLIPFYTYPADDPLDITSCGIYILRIAEGANPATLGNWSVNTIKAYGATAFISEPTILGLSSTKIICIARNETTKEYTCYDSTDNGETWTDQGDLSFSHAFVTAGPARLAKFTHNGVAVAVCYYPDRNGRLLRAIYGKVSSLISNSLTGWDTDTRVIIVPDLLHYGSVLHQNGDLNAIGFYAREPNPQSNTENKIITFYLPTNHEATIEAQLAI